MPKTGLMIVLSGPSGAGKGTIAQELLRREPGIVYSISCTTRPPRPGDEEGVTYYFVSKEIFEQRIEEDAFLEHAYFYNNHYGTPRDFVQRTLESGKDCLVEIDPNGARQILEKEPEAVSLYILPPSMRILYDRLSKRGTEDPQRLRMRFGAAREEMANLPLYRYAVINDDVARAVDEVQAIIQAERKGRQLEAHFSQRMMPHLDTLKEEAI